MTGPDGPPTFKTQCYQMCPDQYQLTVYLYGLIAMIKEKKFAFALRSA